MKPHPTFSHWHSLNYGPVTMTVTEKACPIVVQNRDERIKALAFLHPLAGKQFIKGSIELGETPIAAAERELREESGLALPSPLIPLGHHDIESCQQRWHFFQCRSFDLPEGWSHETDDDDGQTFVFFWHSLTEPLDDGWQPIFHEAFEFFRPRVLL